MASAFRPTTPLRTLTEVIQANEARGNSFFSPGAMRFFRSKVYEDVYPTKFGTFIITSEKDESPYMRPEDCAWGGQRRYSLRFVACRTIYYRSYGHVYPFTRGEVVPTADDFGQYGTLTAARNAAKREQARVAGLLIKDKPVLFDRGHDETEEDQSS